MKLSTFTSARVVKKWKYSCRQCHCLPSHPKYVCLQTRTPALHTAKAGRRITKWEDQQRGIILVCGLHAQTAAAALYSPPRASERVPREQTQTQ
jgi:hypothetical protein